MPLSIKRCDDYLPLIESVKPHWGGCCVICHEESNHYPLKGYYLPDGEDSAILVAEVCCYVDWEIALLGMVPDRPLMRLPVKARHSAPCGSCGRTFTEGDTIGFPPDGDTFISTCCGRVA